MGLNMINLNNITPVAPVGGVNVLWQVDASGNVSAYYGLSTGVRTTYAPVTGVVTIDASLGNSVIINVNDAITSMVVNNPTDGQELTIMYKQDGTGHTIVTPTNFFGTTAPDTTAGKFSVQKFVYDITTTNWYAVAAGVIGM
jgi:hypothetical protein